MDKNFYNIIESEVSAWAEGFVGIIPNLALAILIFLIFYFLSRGVRVLASKLLNRFNDHIALNRLIATIFSLIVFTAGLFFALDIIGLDKTVTSLLAGAGIAGLALSLAFQELASNFIAGVMIAIRKPFKVHDVVSSNDIYGTVSEINLRATIIETPEGQLVIVPNKQIFQNPLFNYSKLGFRLIDLRVGISYGEDLERVMKITKDAVEKVEGRIEEKGVQFYFQEFGDSSINFVVRFWIEFSTPLDVFEPINQTVINIKKAYESNGITIPFPIRTLDFGIKGGKKLDEMTLNMNDISSNKS